MRVLYTLYYVADENGTETYKSTTLLPCVLQKPIFIRDQKENESPWETWGRWQLCSRSDPNGCKPPRMQAPEHVGACWLIAFAFVTRRFDTVQITVREDRI